MTDVQILQLLGMVFFFTFAAVTYCLDQRRKRHYLRHMRLKYSAYLNDTQGGDWYFDKKDNLFKDSMTDRVERHGL